MKQFFLVLSLLPVSFWASAESVADQDSYTSPLNSYQRWTEPSVQDWQETHRQIVAESSGHANHQGMAMPEMHSQSQAVDTPKISTPTLPKMDMKEDVHQGMTHDGMNMPNMSEDAMSSKGVQKKTKVKK